MLIVEKFTKRTNLQIYILYMLNVNICIRLLNRSENILLSEKEKPLPLTKPWLLWLPSTVKRTEHSSVHESGSSRHKYESSPFIALEGCVRVCDSVSLLTGSKSVRLSFHTSSKATTISWSSSRDRTPSRSTSNTLKQTGSERDQKDVYDVDEAPRRCIVPFSVRAGNPTRCQCKCNFKHQWKSWWERSMTVPTDRDFKGKKRHLNPGYQLQLRNGLVMGSGGTCVGCLCGSESTVSLTFLSLSNRPPAACGEPTRDLFKVDVIVPIFIEGVKQA